MAQTLPRTVREAWGEEAADDFAAWFDASLQQRTVHRSEFREVLSRLDVIEERFAQMDERFDRVDARLGGLDERLNQMDARMDDRFAQMDGTLDRMNDRILSMTRWLIGLLVLFGTMVTVLLAIAQFTAG